MIDIFEKIRAKRDAFRAKQKERDIQVKKIKDDKDYYDKVKADAEVFINLINAGQWKPYSEFLNITLNNLVKVLKESSRETMPSEEKAQAVTKISAQIEVIEGILNHPKEVIAFFDAINTSRR